MSIEWNGKVPAGKRGIMIELAYVKMFSVFSGRPTCVKIASGDEALASQWDRSDNYLQYNTGGSLFQRDETAIGRILRCSRICIKQERDNSPFHLKIPDG